MLTDDEFRAWVERIRTRLVGTAVLLLGDRGLAEDAAQETLVQVFRHRRRIRAYEAADSYAYTTLWRLTRRRRFRPDRGLIADNVDEQSWASVADKVADRLDLRDALRALPRRQRETVILRFYSDLSVHEVAELMTCSEGTVKNQTSKALATLAKQVAVQAVRKDTV